MVFPLFTTVEAQPKPPDNKDYTVLTPLPGIGSDSGGQTNLEKYLPAVFNLAVGIAAGLAFVMITFGGITYAVSDSITGKEDGRKWIENALWGLLLVIGAYVILYTINPQILDFKLTIPRPKIEAGIPTVTPGVPMTNEQINEDDRVRNSLPANVTTKDPCLEGQTTGCVNLNGLPDNAVTGLESLATDGCKCSIFISGGTEGGHATHGDGAPIVDLRPNVSLNNYIWGNANTPSDGVSRVKTLPNGQRATFTFETRGGNAGGTSSAPHWHVVIN